MLAQQAEQLTLNQPVRGSSPLHLTSTRTELKIIRGYRQIKTTQSATKGMNKVKEIYQHRDQRARELRKEGKKIIGYLCCYVPLEMMTAADVVPYRITGDVKEPITIADAYTETLQCPFVRNIYDLVLKGRYDFLDGLVIPHTCDNVERNYDALRYHVKPAYSFYINVPHVARPASYQFLKFELESFRKSLEKFTGRQISTPRLQEAIKLHNESRALLRQVCELRKEILPLLSGTEMMEIILAEMSLPVVEGNELLKEILAELKGREPISDKSAARVLVYGCEIDDTAFIELVESCGAAVVMDDLCMGTRYYWHNVETRGDPMDNLSAYCLDKIVCPRTYREGKVKERFTYLLDYAREFKVDGAIFYIIRMCDSHGYDVPDLRDLLRENGFPSLYLEDDYSMETMGPFRTRIQAFVEMLK